jgi:hypothetical protein
MFNEKSGQGYITLSTNLNSDLQSKDQIFIKQDNDSIQKYHKILQSKRLK